LELTHIHFSSIEDDINKAFKTNLPDFKRVKESVLQNVEKTRKGRLHVSFNVSMVDIWVGDLTDTLNNTLPTVIIDSFQRLSYPQAILDMFTEIVEKYFKKYSVTLFPSQITLPPVSYNEPWYNSKEKAQEVFLQQLEKTCEKIKSELYSNICNFLKHVLSKLGFALIKEILRLVSEENIKTKEIGKLTGRYFTTVDEDTRKDEITKTRKEMEIISQNLVDKFYPDYLPVKYQYLYKI